MFCVKIHKSQHGIIVAICDEELIEKNLKYGDISVHVSRDFYCERICDIGEVMLLMSEASCLNLIGKRIVELAIKQGLIHRESIIYLETEDGEKIPHAIVQLFSF